MSIISPKFESLLKSLNVSYENTVDGNFELTGPSGVKQTIEPKVLAEAGKILSDIFQPGAGLFKNVNRFSSTASSYTNRSAEDFGNKLIALVEKLKMPIVADIFGADLSKQNIERLA